MRRWTLAEPLVVVATINGNQIIIPHVLNIPSDVCQSFLNETGEKILMMILRQI